jgi:DNA primase
MKEAENFYRFNLNSTEKGKIVKQYLLKRGLNQDIIDKFGLGFAPRGESLYKLLRDKEFDVRDMLDLSVIRQNSEGNYYDFFSDRLMFPIKNLKGYTIGFSSRTLKKSDQIKYLNSPESKVFRKSDILYNLSSVTREIKKRKRIILYEGFFDVISSTISGYIESVASMGTTLTNNQAKLISSLVDNVVLAYDGDTAGFEATRKAIKILSKYKIKIKVLHLPNKNDPDDFIRKHGKAVFSDRMENLMEPFDYIYSKIRESSDLTITQDRIKFKDEILKLIKESDISLKNIYKEKLSRDLNIDLNDLGFSPQYKYNKNKNLKKKINNKYLMSEVGLIIAMIQENKVAIEKNKELSDEEYVDKEMSMIRYSLEKYFDENESFDINIFSERLSEKSKEKFDKMILLDLDYKNKFMKSNEDVVRYVREIKRYKDQKKRKILIKRRQEENENRERLTQEIKDLERKLSEEDTNEFKKGA